MKKQIILALMLALSMAAPAAQQIITPGNGVTLAAGRDIINANFTELYNRSGGLTITTSTGTLTIGNAKTFTASNTLTLTGTDGSTLNIGAGGTLGTAAFQNLAAFLQPANNLSELTNAAIARANLQLGSAATSASSAFEAAIAAGTTAQYWRGDKSWQTLDASAVGLGSVLNVAQEPALGNPGGNGYVLSSTTTGTRSWVAASAYNPASVAITGGTMNGTAIGGTTPAAGAFTTISSTDVMSLFATGADHTIKNNWSGNNTLAIWNSNPGGYSAIRFLKPDGKERSALGYGEGSAPFDTTFYIETNSYLDGPPSNPPASEDITRAVIPLRFVTTGVINGAFAFYNRGEFRPDGKFAVTRTYPNALQSNSSPATPVLEVGSYNATGAEWNLYNSWSTSGTNYERAVMNWSSNVFRLGTEKAGTGSARGLQIEVAGTDICNFSTAGHLLWNTDNTYDIGASGATRPRNLYVGGSATVAGALKWGATASFPMLQANGIELEAKQADNSAYATVNANNFYAHGNYTILGVNTGFGGGAGDITGTCGCFYVNGGTSNPVRMVRAGVVKVDLNINTTPNRLDFRDTDNSGVIPLSVMLDGSGVVSAGRVRVTSPSVPASATATGTAGEIAWDSGFIYVCTATNTWKRVAISSW